MERPEVIDSAKRYAAAAVALVPLLGCSALAADGPRSGLWQIVSKAVMQGSAMPDQTKTRCLTTDDLQDIEKTFMPRYGTQNGTCSRLDFQWTGQKLSWHVQCTGMLSTDNVGEFNFDKPEHYSATLATKATIAGQETDTLVTIDGQWIGECPQ